MDTTISVLAILAAPLAALGAGYVLQRMTAAHERRMYIFRTLIGERATYLSKPALAAMNLIVLEFRKKKEVLDSWKAFFDYVNDRTNDFNDRDVQDRANTLRAAMLLEMAKVLKMDRHIKLPDLTRGYYPDFVSKPELAARAMLLKTVESMEKTGGIPLALVWPPIPPAGGAAPPGASGGPPARQ